MPGNTDLRYHISRLNKSPQHISCRVNLYRFLDPILQKTNAYKLHTSYIMSRVVRKPAFCICENKDADQLRGNREADQRLCFRYIDNCNPSASYIRNFKPLAIVCGCTAWFVWDLVGNLENRFSHNEAQL